MHDSPDYYQLKISVFNDDKKTELIGETWIDLRDIIVPGGGQNDLWHQLSFKGKYAGDVRMEITFYDSRPRPAQAECKAKKPVSPDGDGQGPSGSRAMPKRRPLPSDPVTGKAPAVAAPTAEHPPAPPRPQLGTPTAFVPSQGLLQQVEHQAPPTPPSGHGTPRTHRMEQPVVHQYKTPERTGRHPSPLDDENYSSQYQQHHPMQTPQGYYDQRSPHDARMPGYPDDHAYDYHEQQQRSPNQFYDAVPLKERDLTPAGEQPPPPPMHRSRNNSGSFVNLAHQNGFDQVKKSTPPSMRHDVLRHEAHRRSAPTTYPGRPTYKAYDSAPAAPQVSETHISPSPRHYSYDASHDPLHRSMQPTVEDVPDSPDAIPQPFRTNRARALQIEPDYTMSPNPAHEYSSLPRQHGQHGQHGQHERSVHGSSAQPMPPREMGSQSHAPYGSPQALTYRPDFHEPLDEYGPPPVPESLVPGMDRAIAREISDRFNEDAQHRRRYTQPPPMKPVKTPPRGRPMDETSPRYDPDSNPDQYGVPPSQSRSAITYSGSYTVQNGMKPLVDSPQSMHDTSPSPRHTIKRKSVSPAPPPSQVADSTRRLSGMPFAPDSYDALNPAVVTSAGKDPAAHRPEYNEATGKIITHDGREIDPSDHLPMDTWAPEPEPREPKKPTSTANTPSSARASPLGAQPLTPSGRRQIRVAIRPQSMCTPPRSGAGPAAFMSYDSMGPASAASASPPGPPSTGRNRLQKKAHRASVAVTISPSSAGGFAGGGSPLSAHSPHPDHNQTPTRGPPPRAATFDTVRGENHHPGPSLHSLERDGSPGSGKGMAGGRAGPPVPAKVSQAGEPVMSGALMRRDEYHERSPRRGAGGGSGGGRADPWMTGAGGGAGGGMGGGGQLTLLEEMQRIDIGSGRARRHDHGY